MLENWKLIKVIDRQWKQDNSGIYTLIYSIENNELRIDIMNSIDMPIVSIQSNNVQALYKGFSDFIELHGYNLSSEHLLYIGKEIQRAKTEGKNYIQD